jgi:hypothetical protein
MPEVGGENRVVYPLRRGDAADGRSQANPVDKDLSHVRVGGCTLYSIGVGTVGRRLIGAADEFSGVLHGFQIHPTPHDDHRPGWLG